MSHTEYSLLDGLSRIDEIVEYAKKHSGVAAISDHRTLAGAGTLANKCKEQDIKPIIGCEFNMCDDISTHNTRGFHLCAYAQNRKGFHNLCQLVTISNKDGFYYVPRIDFNILKQHSDGIIVTSACFGSQFAHDIMDNGTARQRLTQYVDTFGDRFFVEYQNHGFQEETEVMNTLSLEAMMMGIPIIGTLDSHYTNKNDESIHRVLLAMNMQKPYREIHGFDGDGYHLMDDSELLQRFDKEFLGNTMILANMVEENVIDWETSKAPVFTL